MKASELCSFSPQLSAFHDGELAWEQSREVEAHLDACEACTAELAQLRRFSRVFQLAELPPGPPPEYWQDLPQLLDSMPPERPDFDPNEADEDADQDRMRLRPKQPAHLRYVKWMSAAAAAVFVVAAGRMVYEGQTNKQDTGGGTGINGAPVIQSQPSDVKPAKIEKSGAETH